MPEKRWYLYIIQNPRGELYTGITFDVGPDRRIGEHNQNNAKSARFTKGRGPWQLIYAETGFTGRADAQARERALRTDRTFKLKLKKARG